MATSLKPGLDPTACRQRTDRLTDLLQRRRLDTAYLTDYRDVYRLTGRLSPHDLPIVLRVDASGDRRLAAPAGLTWDNSLEVVEYEWSHRGTRHPDPLERCLDVAQIADMFSKAQRVGGRGGSPAALVRALCDRSEQREWCDLDSELAQLARCKDADEIAIVRASVRANQAAYAAVAQSIAPGVTELEVLAAGQRGAMAAAGQKLFHDGDYQSGACNGPARDRAIEAGELYIVDAWTCLRGYWSDMARTYVVGRPPTDVQQSLFDQVVRALETAADMLKPGVDGCELYAAMDERLRKHPALADTGLIHHGGHAIGLWAHELPDVNLDRGGVLEVGDLICLEPGGYTPAARYGVRIESMYYITEQGAERLDDDQYALPQCG